MHLQKRGQFLCLLLLVWSGSSLNQTLQATITHPVYDAIPITSKTWEEVDLKYYDLIQGKRYPGNIELLRPIKWLKEHQLAKVGNHVRLSIPEFAVNQIDTTVMAIKPTSLDTTAIDWSKQDPRPVIGKFVRYAPVVKTYTFIDQHGHSEKIHATPNHPFYVLRSYALMT